MRNSTGSPVLDSVSKDSLLLMLQGQCEDTSQVKSAEEEKPCNVSFSCRMSEKTHPSFPASTWVCGWQSQTLEGFRASSVKSPGWSFMSCFTERIYCVPLLGSTFQGRQLCSIQAVARGREAMNRPWKSPGAFGPLTPQTPALRP